LTSPTDQFNQQTIAEFRANHGRVGGTFAGVPLLLLHTVGARSGPINPTMYLAGSDDVARAASRAGHSARRVHFRGVSRSPTTCRLGDVP